MIIDDKILDTWNKRFERIEQSQSSDRTDIDNILIELKTIREQNERILKVQTRNQQKTTEAVQDAIQPIQDSLDEFTEKKVVKVNDLQIKNLLEKKTLWSVIRRWNKR